MFRPVSVGLLLVMLAAFASGAIFQDEVEASNAGPVFQDQVPREGYVEVEPGVYAPKIDVVPPKPQKPFEFNSHEHLEDEIGSRYTSLVTETDPYLHVKDFVRFTRALMNPANVKLYDVEEELFMKRVNDFRAHHGLSDDSEANLYRGFLDRGQCLRFFHNLATDLRKLRAKTHDALLAAGRKAEVEAVEGALDSQGKPRSVFQDGN